MKSRAWCWKILFAVTFFSVVVGWYCCVLAHHTDVHGSATNNLTQQAIDTSEVSFYSTDEEWMKQGAMDEDLALADLTNLPPDILRYWGHHYNPHTGSGGPFGGNPAVQIAEGRWDLVGAAFTNSSTRWYGDESQGTQGSMHALGRVLHLLQDMASPPHVHAPDGHGRLSLRGPGGGLAGYYSDFEEKWSPDSSVYAGWGYPSASGGALTPSNATSASIPNSRLDSDSLTEMRARLSAIPSSERSKIEGYMKAMAWITYFHTSFYGQINKDENNPAPASSGSGYTSILRRMFPSRISFYGSVLDDYWTIDGVGYYEKKLQYFPDEWWPCPATTADNNSNYPIGHKVVGSSIQGRFYLYMHYYQTGDYVGPSSRAIPPDYYPNGSSNSLDLAHYYGNVLLPLAARFGAGLLNGLFPAPSSLSYPSTSADSQISVSWQAPPDSVAGSAENYYVLQRSDDGGSVWSTVYGGSGLQYNDNVGQGSYRYRVHASFGSGYSPRIYGAWRAGTYDCTVGEPPGPGSETSTLTATEYANVWSAIPTYNGVGNSSITVFWNDPSSGDAYGLLKFNLSSIPNGSTVDTVRLELNCTRDDGNLQIAIFDCGSNWYSSSVNWNNRPSFGSFVEFTNSSGVGTWTWQSSDFDDVVQGWIDSTNYGLYIIANNSGGLAHFSSGLSLVNFNLRPKLVVSYTPPPPPDLIITDLYPSPAPSSGTFYVGDDIDWYVTVKNNSVNGYAEASRVGYYLGNSPADISEDTRINRDSTDSLGPGQSDTDDDPYTFTSGDIGSKYLICKADYRDDVEEINENNNTRVYGPFNVAPAKVFYTLTTSVAGGHGTISAGGTYESGEVINLIATPDAGYKVKSWSGTDNDNSTATTNTVTMTSNKTVTVEFVLERPSLEIYVDDDAPNDPGPVDPSVSDPLEDGTAGHPFDEIQEAVDVAIDGDTVIVAEGTYYENLNLNDKDIILNSTDPSNQNVVANTIVNGGGNDSVIYTIDSDVTINGFTITNGFVDAGGGGICCYDGSPTISHCIFSGNWAIAGGGIFIDVEENSTISPILTNCIFLENSADYGGAIGIGSWMGENNATLVNCLFRDNSAALFGGVMDVWNYLGSTDIELINCTLAGNSAPNGNALSFDSDLQAYPSNLQVSNCILWNGNDEIWNGDGSTITINYSDIQSGWSGPGENNINVDPNFIDADNDNFHLLAGSQCIDAGDNNALPPDTADLDGDGNTTEPTPWDLDGNPRIIGDEVDMGCYESSSIDPNNPTPVLQAIGDKFVDENVALTFTVNATDPEDEPVIYSAPGLPSGATLDPQTGEFAWTPSYNQAGSYQVTFRASDGNSWDSETITITVNNINRPPVIGAITDPSVNENALLSLSVNAIDPDDPDGQALTYSISGLPAGAVFASKTLTWTPSYAQAGKYLVTFTADDGQAQDSQAITITVINVNRTPILGGIGAIHVSPSSGYTSTDFYWYVDYYDADGDSPSIRDVYIDGMIYQMELDSGSNSNGTYKYGPMNLGVGSHSYYFFFTDGQGGSARLPSSGMFSGLSVSDVKAIYHLADLNSNYVISMLEILACIDEWAIGDVSMLEVLEAIDLWAAGHYYWDESEQKFKSGEQP